MTNNVSTLLTVDDTDPRLIYEGSWTESESSGEYDSTAHGTVIAGSSVLFVFNGTFVAVYGTVGTSGSNSSYVLDALPPVQYSAPPFASPVYNQAFYSSEILTNGKHSLNITSTADGENFLLDYLQYTTTDLGAASESSAHPAPTSSSIGLANSSKSHMTLSAGVICGIVIGSIVFLTVVTCILLWMRSWCCFRSLRGRKLRRGDEVDMLLSDMPNAPPPTMDILRKFKADLHPSAVNIHAPPTSYGTESSAVFTSVIFLTPPVSTVSGNSAGKNRQHPRNVS
ncbi:hypothetical protein BKA93DRAFT_828643 [Sparassis latifolia]|uniref:Uncharacterized protein n=1 Tax=Sparassis crispa TaxID=139825 RepID=A0A401H378_9APHY|nr:hypothetical protein SCP_1402720 [Sparassis crispa]GBE88864.1 hypothetical protein SCP_1402720 [Sparassis crispa]